MLRCVAPDAVFEHPLFVVRGQAAFHWMYEGWSLLNRRRVTYDATMSGALAAMGTDEGSAVACPLYTWSASASRSGPQSGARRGPISVTLLTTARCDHIAGSGSLPASAEQKGPWAAVRSTLAQYSSGCQIVSGSISAQ